VNSEKYIGLDVHQATISVAVLDHSGKVVMECILETKATTILEFFAGLRGTLSVTFEEGTSAAWLYDLLRPHVARLVVSIRGKTLCSSRATRAIRTASSPPQPRSTEMETENPRRLSERIRSGFHRE
jgi:hypothetical protein